MTQPLNKPPAPARRPRATQYVIDQAREGARGARELFGNAVRAAEKVQGAGGKPADARPTSPVEATPVRREPSK